MKMKNIGDITTIIIFTLLMTLSTFIITANSINYNMDYSKNVNYCSNIYKLDTLGPIIWDNGMNIDGLGAAQWDEVGGFDAFCADDFFFENDTLILEINWIGGYYIQGEPASAEFDWCISFFLDDGSGGSPIGTPYQPSYEGPFCYSWEEITVEEIDPGYYKMSVFIPGGINFSGDVKYWIAIWGVGAYPPQSGWGYHITPIYQHMGVCGSNYWGIPFWTDTQVAYEETMDFCFQLKTEGPPIPDLDCIGSLVWYDVEINSTVTGEFQLGNIGEEGSLLNWTIKSFPSWGAW